MIPSHVNEELGALGLLTQVSAGTPMGELMRRYWHPVAAAGELVERPTKAVRILGEDLVSSTGTSPARSASSNASAPTGASTSPTASPRSTASAACTTAG